MSVGHLGVGGAGSRRRVITGALLAIVAALFFYPRAADGAEAASDSTEIAKKQHELTVEAQGLQKKGDFPAALKKANEAVALAPTGLEPRITRAGILMALERYKDALDNWSVVVAKMGPGSTHTYRLYQYRGLCRLKLGDRAGARADALEAKRLAPKSSDPEELAAIESLLDASTMAQASAGPSPDPAAEKKTRGNSSASSDDGKSPFATKKQEDLAHEAIILQEKGDLPAALKKVNEAVDSFPAAMGPHLVCGGILMALERYKDALDDWAFLKTKMEPGDAHAYQLRLFSGQCRLKLGDKEGARTDALEAKRLAPKSIDPTQMETIEDLLGEAEIEGMDLQGPAGKAILKRQIELTAAATALRDKGDLSAALKKVNEAVDLLSLTANPHLARATILMDLGNYKEALKDWTDILEPMIDLEDFSRTDADAYFLYSNRGLCRLSWATRRAPWRTFWKRSGYLRNPSTLVRTMALESCLGSPRFRWERSGHGSRPKAITRFSRSGNCTRMASASCIRRRFTERGSMRSGHQLIMPGPVTNAL